MKAFNKTYLSIFKTEHRKKIAFSALVQTFFQFLGIAIHNPFRDECCIDFECCNPYKDKSKNRCWLHISKKQLPFTRDVWYEATAPIGTPGRTFVKCSKWVFNWRKKNVPST